MATNDRITLLLNRPRDWSAYYRALKQADKCWATWCDGQETTYGVFSGHCTYLRTIELGRRVMLGDWVTFTREDYEIALGLKDQEGYDYGLLGSMNSAGRARHFFLSATPTELSMVGVKLAPVISASPADMARAARDAVEGIVRVPGIAMGVASRLLALARPDTLVSVNGSSRPRLAEVTAISEQQLQFPSGYAELVKWTLDQPWWNSKRPTDPTERAAWNARAALLDSFVYEP